MARMFQLLNGDFVIGVEKDDKLIQKVARVILQQQGEQIVFSLVPFGSPFIREFSTVLSSELMFIEIPNTNEFTKAVFDKYYEAVINPAIIPQEPKKKSTKKAKKTEEVDPSESEWR